MAERYTAWLWHAGQEALEPSPRWVFLSGSEDELEIVAETCWMPTLLGDLSDTEYGAFWRWVGRAAIEQLAPEDVSAWEAREDRLWLTGNRRSIAAGDLAELGAVDESAGAYPPGLEAASEEHEELCYVYLVTTRRELAQAVVNRAFPHLPPVPADTPLIRTTAEVVQGDLNRRRAVRNWVGREDPVQTPITNDRGERIAASMGSEASAVAKLRWTP